jgi:hypothetical protein
MKAIHSFWSKPYLANRWGLTDQYRKNIFTYALSALYAKRMFGNISLVCDTKGAELLEIIGYDTIDISLNELENVNPKFWAYGKIKSLSLYNEPIVHLDGDVLLKGDNLIPIFDSSWDVLVQMKEIETHFSDTYTEMLPVISEIMGWNYGRYNYAFNCGVLAFKDVAFKNRFCHTFFDSIEKCNGNMDLVDTIDQKYEINCALEQSLLTCMSENDNKYVKEILTYGNKSLGDLDIIANELGYAHLWGKSKYNDYWLDKIKARLYQLDRNLYYKVVHQYEKYKIE